MATKRKRKQKVKKSTVKELDAKVQELIDILRRNGKFIPDAPSMKDLDKADGCNFHNSNKRKGHGTGNTKQNKRQMKKNHRLLLIAWITLLQNAFDDLRSE